MDVHKVSAFSTLGCPDLDLAQVCELARRWDLSSLELRCLQGRMDLPALFEETYGTPQNLAEAVSGLGVGVHLLGTSLTLIASTRSQREEFLRFVPWAEALQVPWLRVFDGGTPGCPPTSAQVAEAVETIRWWRDVRRRSRWQVDILMETHTACVTSSACLVIQRELAEPLSLLWDAHHTWRAGEPVARTWEALGPFVQHVHVKDSLPDASTPAGYRYVLPGAGEFPWRELQQTWGRGDYRGIISLEWEKKWHPALPALAAALASAHRAGWV